MKTYLITDEEVELKKQRKLEMSSNGGKGKFSVTHIDLQINSISLSFSRHQFMQISFTNSYNHFFSFGRQLCSKYINCHFSLVLFLLLLVKNVFSQNSFCFSILHGNVWRVVFHQWLTYMVRVQPNTKTTNLERLYPFTCLVWFFNIKLDISICIWENKKLSVFYLLFKFFF